MINLLHKAGPIGRRLMVILFLAGFGVFGHSMNASLSSGDTGAASLSATADGIISADGDNENDPEYDRVQNLDSVNAAASPAVWESVYTEKATANAAYQILPYNRWWDFYSVPLPKLGTKNFEAVFSANANFGASLLFQASLAIAVLAGAVFEFVANLNILANSAYVVDGLYAGFSKSFLSDSSVAEVSLLGDMTLPAMALLISFIWAAVRYMGGKRGEAVKFLIISVLALIFFVVTSTASTQNHRDHVAQGKTMSAIGQADGDLKNVSASDPDAWATGSIGWYLAWGLKGQSAAANMMAQILDSVNQSFASALKTETKARGGCEAYVEGIYKTFDATPDNGTGKGLVRGYSKLIDLTYFSTFKTGVYGGTESANNTWCRIADRQRPIGEQVYLAQQAGLYREIVTPGGEKSVVNEANDWHGGDDESGYRAAASFFRPVNSIALGRADAYFAACTWDKNEDVKLNEEWSKVYKAKTITSSDLNDGNLVKAAAGAAAQAAVESNPFTRFISDAWKLTSDVASGAMAKVVETWNKATGDDKKAENSPYVNNHFCQKPFEAGQDGFLSSKRGDRAEYMEYGMNSHVKAGEWSYIEASQNDLVSSVVGYGDISSMSYFSAAPQETQDFYAMLRGHRMRYTPIFAIITIVGLGSVVALMVPLLLGAIIAQTISVFALAFFAFVVLFLIVPTRKVQNFATRVFWTIITGLFIQAVFVAIIGIVLLVINMSKTLLYDPLGHPLNQAVQLCVIIVVSMIACRMLLTNVFAMDLSNPLAAARSAATTSTRGFMKNGFDRDLPKSFLNENLFSGRGGFMKEFNDVAGTERVKKAYQDFRKGWAEASPQKAPGESAKTAVATALNPSQATKTKTDSKSGAEKAKAAGLGTISALGGAAAAAAAKKKALPGPSGAPTVGLPGSDKSAATSVAGAKNLKALGGSVVSTSDAPQQGKKELAGSAGASAPGSATASAPGSVTLRQDNKSLTELPSKNSTPEATKALSSAPGMTPAAAPALKSGTPGTPGSPKDLAKAIDGITKETKLSQVDAPAASPVDRLASGGAKFGGAHPFGPLDESKLDASSLENYKARRLDGVSAPTDNLYMYSSPTRTPDMDTLDPMTGRYVSSSAITSAVLDDNSGISRTDSGLNMIAMSPDENGTWVAEGQSKRKSLPQVGATAEDQENYSSWASSNNPMVSPTPPEFESLVAAPPTIPMADATELATTSTTGMLPTSMPRVEPDTETQPAPVQDVDAVRDVVSEMPLPETRKQELIMELDAKPSVSMADLQETLNTTMADLTQNLSAPPSALDLPMDLQVTAREAFTDPEQVQDVMSNLDLNPTADMGASFRLTPEVAASMDADQVAAMGAQVAEQMGLAADQVQFAMDELGGFKVDVPPANVSIEGLALDTSALANLEVAETVRSAVEDGMEQGVGGSLSFKLPVEASAEVSVEDARDIGRQVAEQIGADLDDVSVFELETGEQRVVVRPSDIDVVAASFDAPALMSNDEVVSAWDSYEGFAEDDEPLSFGKTEEDFRRVDELANRSGLAAAPGMLDLSTRMSENVKRAREQVSSLNRLLSSKGSTASASERFKSVKSWFGSDSEDD